MSERTICPPEHSHGENTVCRAKHGCQCDDCRRTAAEYEFWRYHQHRTGRKLRIDSTGTIRRIRALQALGWSHEAISAQAGFGHGWSAAICRRGMVSPTTAATIVRVYDAMSMRLPPAQTIQQVNAARRARNHAARMGWPPPLALDDDTIDLPDNDETNERKAAA